MPQSEGDTTPPPQRGPAGRAPLRAAHGSEPGRDREPGWDRRTFVNRGALAASSLLFGLRHHNGGASPHRRGHRGKAHRKHSPPPPNILTIIVDQLRTPVWMPPGIGPAAVMPNLSALQEHSVNFERHYTAANDCSPSRSVLLTGLYTHQTGVMITGDGWLNPRFPTWGALLRKMGYETTYYGKWHLTPNEYAPLEPYGFAGGTYPSPNGNPGQGTSVDPLVAEQFVEWFDGYTGAAPWATTVSFVNPHDIVWWHRFTEHIEAEAHAPSRATALPPNFESPEELLAKGKPQLQRSLQDTAGRSFGEVPFAGAEALARWTNMMDTYLLLQEYVDVQIGKVLATLASRPEVAANTVIVFTSDHGEYGGSHGMRGKGASAYEEALRVPLCVYDPRGTATAATHVPRTQLTSSADIVPLMLTLASGSESWRQEPEYAHLANRHSIARICANPRAPGRPWVLHTTDEDVTEFAAEAYAAGAPRHVVAIRSPQAKLVLYSNWRPGTIEVEAGGQEAEFYDYSTEDGRLETSGQAGPKPAAADGLWRTLERAAIPDELRSPLPSHLRSAHRQGLSRYFAFEEGEALKVLEAHLPEAPEPVPEPG